MGTYISRGVITKIKEVDTTLTGVALRQFFFKEDEDNDYIYPTVMGKNLKMLDEFKPGDYVEMTAKISGSKEQYTNCIVRKLVKID